MLFSSERKKKSLNSKNFHKISVYWILWNIIDMLLSLKVVDYFDF